MPERTSFTASLSAPFSSITSITARWLLLYEVPFVSFALATARWSGVFPTLSER